MPSQFFSPNAKISGGAAFFSFNSKDGSVYIKLLKQIANNPNKKGNFDGANPVNIKLSQDEAADFVRAVRTSGESKFFHKFEANTTSGSLKFYTIPAKDNFPARSGFGLSVKKSADGKETEIKVGFTLGSAERLSIFLTNALTHIMDAEYSQDIKDAKEYAEKKKNAASVSVPDEAKEDVKETEEEIEF
jgi:hypothetical protein